MKRCLLTTTALLAIALPSQAARPLLVDDVAPVEPGRFQLEAGVGYVKDSLSHHFDFPLALGYGLVTDFQVGIGTGGQFEQREDALGGRETVGSFHDVLLATKWNPIPQERFGVAIALSGAVKLPTCDCERGFGSNRVDTDLTLIATRRWTEKFATHLNAGYSWIGSDADVMHYGVAAEYALTAKLSLVAEVFADTPVNNAGSTAVLCNGGLRYAVTPDFVLDTAAGTSLRGTEPDVMVTVGFTWLFDFRRK